MRALTRLLRYTHRSHQGVLSCGTPRSSRLLTLSQSISKDRVNTDTMSVHEIAVTGYLKGDEYDGFRPTYTDNTIAFISKLLSEVNVSPERDTEFDILELGAGTGIFTRNLLPVLPKSTRYIATEPSRAFLNVLKTKSPDVVARQCAADAIPLADNSVKSVLCAQCFHWFASKAALDEIRRVIAPGGKLVLVWNMRDVSIPWVREVEDIVAKVTGEDADKLPTSFNWRKVFAGNLGFKDETRTRMPGTPLKGTVDTIVRYYSTFSMISCLEEELQKQTLQSIREVVEKSVTGEGYYPFNTEIFTYQCDKE